MPAIDGGTCVVRARRLIDGTAGGAPREAALLIRDGAIVDVGRIDDFDAEPGAVVVDAGERTVLPGLIDAHMHFYGVPSTQLHGAPFERDGFRALRAAGEAARMLDAGFTAARCCGSTIGPDLRRAIDAGHVPGPRLVAVGTLLCTTAGTHDPENGLVLPHAWAREQALVGDGPDELRRLVRMRVREGATAIKIGVSKPRPGDVFGVWGDDPRDQLLAIRRHELEAIVDEAHANGLFVSAHCIGDAPVRLAVETGVDTIEHGFGIGDETRALLVDTQRIVVTTFSAMRFMLEALDELRLGPAQRAATAGHVEAQRIDFQRGLEAGVRYAIGTDLIGSPTHPNDRAAREFRSPWSTAWPPPTRSWRAPGSPPRPSTWATASARSRSESAPT